MRLLLPLLCATLLAGCPSSAPPAPAATPAATPPPSRIADVPAAASALQRFTALSASRACSIDARKGLLSLHDRFPDDTAVDDPLIAALRACEDWTALGELLAARAGGPADKGPLTRAKVHIKAFEFDVAVSLLRPLAAASPDDPEVAWALGLALFDGGRRDEALTWVDAVADARADQGRSDGLVLQGLAALDAGDAARAIPLLERAVSVDESDRAAWNALGRARARAGDDAGAAAAFDEAAARNAEVARVEAAAFRLSGLVTALNKAYEARRFDDTLALVDEILPLASPQLKGGLYDIRAAVLKSTGDAAGAEEAARGAARWKKADGGTP